jgi:hypothetical protein
VKALPETLTGPGAGPILNLLEALQADPGESAVDVLWIFPPPPGRNPPGGVLVAAAFGDDAGRRRVFTAHHTRRAEPGVQPRVVAQVSEHGSAPEDRVDRLIEGVLRRLDEDPAATVPHVVRLGGDAARWQALRAALQQGSGASAS